MTKGPEPLRPTDWDVTWAPAGNRGPAMLRVSIGAAVAWPQPGAEYRVTVCGPAGATLVGAAWLGERRRSAAVPAFLPDVPRLDDVTAWARAVTAGDRRDDDLLRRVAEAERLDDTLISELIAFHGRTRWFPDDRAIPKAVWEHEVRLELRAGGAVLAQERPRAPRRARIDWARPIDKPGDPCHGMLPEACVYQRLRAIKDAFCLTPSMFLECLLLGSWLDATPPAIFVACDIDGGAHAAETSSITGLITVNGHVFLTDEWLEATLIHEISHVIDYHTGRIEKVKAYKRAVEAANEASDELRELDRRPFVPNPDEWQRRRDRALQTLTEARATIERCRSDYRRELIESECRALFYVLSHDELLDHPADWVPCVVNACKGMIQQLHGLAGDDHHDVVADCLRRIKAWVDAHPEVKQAFDQDMATDEHTWSEALDILIGHYGGG